jgi:hypothetical protein
MQTAPRHIGDHPIVEEDIGDYPIGTKLWRRFDDIMRAIATGDDDDDDGELQEDLPAPKNPPKKKARISSTRVHPDQTTARH